MQHFLNFFPTQCFFSEKNVLKTVLDIRRFDCNTAQPIGKSPSELLASQHAEIARNYQPAIHFAFIRV